MSAVLIKPDKIKPLKKKVRQYAKKGYTVREIAKESGVGATTVQRIKNGTRISQENAEKLELFFLDKNI